MKRCTVLLLSFLVAACFLGTSAHGADTTEEEIWIEKIKNELIELDKESEDILLRASRPLSVEQGRMMQALVNAYKQEAKGIRSILAYLDVNQEGMKRRKDSFSDIQDALLFYREEFKKLKFKK